MPVTLQLSTMPGTIERYDAYSTQLAEPFGGSLGQQSVVVAKTTDIRAAVQAFGATVRASYPDASFLISIRRMDGERKLRGYDAAKRGNGFGQEDFLHVVDLRTNPAAPAEAPAVEKAAELGIAP